MIEFQKNIAEVHRLRTSLFYYKGLADTGTDLESYLILRGFQVISIEDTGKGLDIEVGDISVSLDKDYNINHTILIRNIGDDKVGGWVEYDTITGNIKFPFI